MTPAFPLSGVRVADFSTRYPGPYATQLLLHLGADVVKVEAPWGDPQRSVPSEFDLLNRGKRSIALDLKKQDDREIAQSLIKRSDVVVENFRPGVADRLGIGWMDAAAVNPACVYCSISSFGQEGPMAHHVGHDINFLAFGGELADGAGLAYGPVWLTDVTSSLYATIAILAALPAAGATGKGTYIDLAMSDAAIASMGMELARRENPAGTPWLQTDIPHYGVFPTRDGKQIALGVDTEDEMWQRLAKELDLDLPQSYATSLERVENQTIIRKAVAAAVATQDAYDLEDKLQAAGVPATVVRQVSDAARSDHAQARRLVSWENGRPEIAPPFLTQAGTNWGGESPALDQHRYEILSGLDPDQ